MKTAAPKPEIRGGFDPPAWLGATQARVLGLGVLGVVATVGGWFAVAPERFFASYLVAFLFWFGIGMGCLGLGVLNHITGGTWGIVVRRVFEAGARTLPLLVLLFVPVLLGMNHLYVWTRPEIVAGNEILQGKQAYLNTAFFTARAALYYVVWLVMATLLARWSMAQQETRDPRWSHRLAALGAVGVLVYILTATFAAFDWLMSLDPLWFSSIYGFHFVVGHGVSAFCLVILVAAWLQRTPPMDAVFRPRHFDDWGKLLFAFNLLWIYVTFSQFLIIWSGNLPEEIPWFLERRTHGYWEWSVAMFALHFFVPFFILLSRRLRQNTRVMVGVAFMVLLAHWLDLYWQAMPSLQPTLSPHWLDAAAWLGLGGLWGALFIRNLRQRALLPLGEPALSGAVGDA